MNAGPATTIDRTRQAFVARLRRVTEGPDARRAFAGCLRALTGFVCLTGLLFSTACSNDITEFCTESTATLCERCWECGADDAEASRICGFVAIVDKAGCQTMLDEVCTSDDSAYNVETGRACAERIEKVSCQQLAKKGKPDVCARLF